MFKGEEVGVSEREAAISIKDLHKRFGAFEVLKGISLEAKKGDVIAIIGGADGPTTITIGVPDQKNVHVACSALHFEPVHEGIEWRIEFGVNEPLKETFQLV